jgi:ADP-L-glycero-D-manno-heptose 6-epimerase
MKKNDLIVITGAAGFIGSCLAGYLNEQGFENLVLVDDFGREDKEPNLQGKKIHCKVDREEFFEWLNQQELKPAFVLHIGARTDTTEFNYDVHQKWNVEYSQKIWDFCTIHQIPLIYASSAATYGAGELGYKDDHELSEQLQPLNPYGVSKNEFDKWVLHHGNHPPFWAGLKFFNVYGPNEFHKGRMASVIWHSFLQIQRDGQVKLFKSHRPDFKDGEQLRDFVYVKDVLKVIGWLMEHAENLESGIFNLGTGKARAFKDLVAATFAGMDRPANIVYIDMPEDIRDKYQYFTEADMSKLRAAGYQQPFYSLEEGVDDYVRNYLVANKYY